MKKFLLPLLFFASALSAETLVEGRVAAFFPLSHDFQDVYGTVNPSYQIEIATRVNCNLFLFANVEEFYRSVHLGDCGSSSIQILTPSFGPKYFFCLSECFDFYLGGALAIACAEAKNHSFTTTKESSTSLGVVAKSGINYYFYQSFFADLFLDYSYQRAFRSHVDIGGFRAGLGLGLTF